MPNRKTESTWKDKTGLADDRTYARIYPTEVQKSTWMEEAENEGFSSLSKYLIHLIHQARTARDIGTPPHQADAEIEDLEQTVEELRVKLKQERQKHSGTRQIADADVVTDFLTDTPQPLPEIMKRIVESGALDEFVRKRVEDQLYFMSQHDDAIYDRQGGGWRLPQNGGGD